MREITHPRKRLGLQSAASGGEGGEGVCGGGELGKVRYKVACARGKRGGGGALGGGGGRGKVSTDESVRWRKGHVNVQRRTQHSVKTVTRVVTSGQSIM